MTTPLKRRVIGTAGHIDHGKTSLVRALTGIDTDRLPEEKKRGITIDLGFAFLRTGDYQIGFVDVPGHERFIRNMLAGAGGFDAVLLVVAADESVKPQTREHFEICKLLDLRSGLIAITKCDLVDADIIDLVSLEVAELVKGSFLEGKPILPVSSSSGEGLPALRRELENAVEEAVQRREDHRQFRLPIDRAFTVKGFGSVITGTTIAGSVRRDDELEILPDSIMTKARTIEVHGEARNGAEAGERTSINLADVALDQLHRGQQLAHRGSLRTTQILTVELQLLANTPPLKDQARLRVHHYAAELLGTVRLLDTEEPRLPPGKSCVAQLRLESPIAAAIGDRFVIRRHSPAMTLGGGRILETALPKLARGTRPEILATLGGGSLLERIELMARMKGVEGLMILDVAQRFAVRPDFVRAALKEGESRLSWVDEQRLLHPDVIATTRRQTMDFLRRHFATKQMSLGIPKREFSQKLMHGADMRIIDFLLDDLIREKIIRIENEVVDVPGRSREAGGAEGELARTIENRFRQAALQVPAVSELIRSITQKPKVIEGVISFLVKSGTLVRLAEGVYVHRDTLEAASQRLRERSGEMIDIASFKDFFQISRKVAIPLLEWFDRSGVTKRSGDRRQVL